MEHVIREFTRIGARVAIEPLRGRAGRSFDLTVRADRRFATSRDETFVLRLAKDAPTVHVLQTLPRNRHLVLLVATEAKERFLCGHDERHWFVATVNEPVNTVADAKRALLPRAMRDLGLRPADLHRRRNVHFKRQGEWFFVPVTDTKVLARIASSPIHRAEPIFRPGGGKRHHVAELVRFGGQSVVIANGTEYTEAEWARLMNAGDFARGKRVERRMKDPEVYCRGNITHVDHETLRLECWHRLHLNGEIRSGSMSFYD